MQPASNIVRGTLPRLSLRRLRLAVLAALIGPLVTPAHARPAHDPLDEVLGCHEYSGGKRQREALEGAIEDVADEFNPFVRPIVRSRLKKANPIAARLCFERNGDELSVTMDARRYRAPLNGKTVKVKGITGDELELRLEIGEYLVSQIFRGEEGGRVNAFYPTKAGGIEMRVRVFSERLPRSLEYGLSYRRASQRQP